MSSEWDEHRDRFSERQETFDAYVEVWSRDLDTRRKFADWITFARCADADLSMVRSAPDLVRQAELLLSRNGYRLGSGAGGASRRWMHKRGEVRTTSERPVHDPAKVRSSRRASAEGRPAAARAPKAPAVPRVKKPAPPPKAPPKPTHVECPYDPGMMVPLTGSCMCGWSPSDAE